MERMEERKEGRKRRGRRKKKGKEVGGRKILLPGEEGKEACLKRKTIS